METEIKQLLSLSEDELLFRIGQEIVGMDVRGEPRNSLIQKQKYDYQIAPVMSGKRPAQVLTYEQS